VGRPARINRQLIAEAANDIGLADLTLKAVADHLGVSITGLYHHIDDKDDLMRLAAEYSANRVPLPEDHGQHWALWLFEWATYCREVFLAEPGLLGQYLEGAISAEAIADKVDAMLGLMVRQSFTVAEAQAAFDLVNSSALGSAVQAIREAEAAKAGRAPLAEHHRVLAQHAPTELPYLRQLVADQATRAPPTFRSQLTTVLIGIASRRGEGWEPIVDLIDESHTTDDHQVTTT
jgi:AcrR family transcriptional regulator